MNRSLNEGNNPPGEESIYSDLPQITNGGADANLLRMLKTPLMTAQPLNMEAAASAHLRERRNSGNFLDFSKQFSLDFQSPVLSGFTPNRRVRRDSFMGAELDDQAQAFRLDGADMNANQNHPEGLYLNPELQNGIQMMDMRSRGPIYNMINTHVFDPNARTRMYFNVENPTHAYLNQSRQMQIYQQATVMQPKENLMSTVSTEAGSTNNSPNHNVPEKDGRKAPEEGTTAAKEDPQSDSVRKIGTLTVEERKQKIKRYLEKRKRRIWSKKITYDCRKRVADNRLRYKGRFVTKDQARILLGLPPDAEIKAEDFEDKCLNPKDENARIQMEKAMAGLGIIKYDEALHGPLEDTLPRQHAASLNPRVAESKAKAASTVAAGANSATTSKPVTTASSLSADQVSPGMASSSGSGALATSSSSSAANMTSGTTNTSPGAVTNAVEVKKEAQPFKNAMA